MDQPRVYSYLRFSDPRQAAGHSAERQAEFARRWAEARGMVLDAALSMRDEGLSAYHQRHVTQGALGVFLAAVSDGRIPAGSVLVVEGLDRLSRAEPIQAQAQLASIVNAGITVVTASDGREYNRERLKAQPMDLVYSLLVMIRAHEESDTKSRRVRAAVRRQCDGWVAGTWRGPIRNGKDPAWVRWDGSGWVLVPERAEAMREAVRMFRAGEGGVRIVRALARRGVVMNSASLYKALRLPALMGTKRIEADGVPYALEGYYPAILTAAEFAELQHLAGQRFRRRGKGEIPGLLTGLGILVCGYCGGAVVAQNMMGRRRREDGAPQDGHRRLMCVNASKGSGCDVGGSCSVVPLERALLGYCSDQINLSALLHGEDRAQGLRTALAVARQAQADTEAQLARLTEALLDDAGAPPAAFARRARELEAQLASLAAEAEAAEQDLARLARADTPALAETWARLAEAALALDEAARLQVRQLVADTFERVVLYHRGTLPGMADGRAMDILLIARGGGWRGIRVDRRTGDWRAGIEGPAPGA